MRFHAVAMVKDGANERYWAFVRKELSMPLSLRPQVKTALLAALGKAAEGTTALADEIRAATEDPAAPDGVPGELQAKIATFDQAFGAELAPHMPAPAPAPAPAPVIDPAALGGGGAPAPEPEPMMSAADVAAADTQVAQVMSLIGTVKALFGKQPKVAKNDVVVKAMTSLAEIEAALARVGGQLAIAKAKPLTLNAKQWTTLYNDGFQQFIGLLLQLMPFLAAVEDAGGGAPAPAPAGAGAPASDPAMMPEAMAKSIEGPLGVAMARMQGVMEQTLAPVAKQVEDLAGLPARFVDLEKTVDKIAKARDGSAGAGGDSGAAPPKKAEYNVDLAARAAARANGQQQPK